MHLVEGFHVVPCVQLIMVCVPFLVEKVVFFPMLQYKAHLSTHSPFHGKISTWLAHSHSHLTACMHGCDALHVVQTKQHSSGEACARCAPQARQG